VKRPFDAKRERVEHDKHHTHDVAQQTSATGCDVQQNHPKEQALRNTRNVANLVRTIDAPNVIATSKQVGCQHPQDWTEQYDKPKQSPLSPQRLASPFPRTHRRQ
jgi:hypothetical protein